MGNNNDKKVLACIDQSHFAEYVADYAAWAATRLNYPLELLHVVDRHLETGSGEDHSGAIGMDAQEQLLTKMSEDDAAKTRAAREQGRKFLDELRNRALSTGLKSVDMRQRQGHLAETLAEQEQNVDLLVMGRRGEAAEVTQRDLGRNVETVVRSWQKLILTVTEPFREPQRALIAFDGRSVTRKCVETVASNPLFSGLEVHVLMVGPETRSSSEQLDWAGKTLAEQGFEPILSRVLGDPEAVIAKAVQDQSIDVLVMGGYSHSPVRNLFFGSKTSDLLRAVKVPTLIAR